MSYTDQEIADLTNKLAQAGADKADIESFVKSAKEAQALNPPVSMALRPDQQQTQQANQAVKDQAVQTRLANAAVPMGMQAGVGPIAGENQAMESAARNSVVDTGLEAGGATLGQSLGATTGPYAPLAIPAFGAGLAMAGNAVAQGRRMITGEQDKPNWGQFAGAGLAGAIPGVSIGKGLLKPALVGAYYGAGNLAAKTAETGINQLAQANPSSSFKDYLPSQAQALTAFGSGFLGAGAQKVLGNVGALTDQQKLNFVRDSRFRDLRGEGVKVAPHEMGQGFDAVSSIGGKAAVQQQASLDNVKAWQRMAREDLGLSSEALPFKEGDVVSGKLSDFDKVREEAYKPYQELAAISPNTEKDLDMLRIQNRGVQDAYLAYKAAKITREDYDRVVNTRDALESALQQKAASVGRPDLVPEMLASKKRIAMAYAYQNATNQGSGFVHPDSLGAQLTDGVPLTDNAKRMALFSLAFPKSSIVQGPAPGVSALPAMAAGQAMAEGTPSGLMAAGYQMTAPAVARKYLLSNFAQNRYASLPENTNESISSALARFAAEQKARENK